MQKIHDLSLVAAVLCLSVCGLSLISAMGGLADPEVARPVFFPFGIVAIVLVVVTMVAARLLPKEA